MNGSAAARGSASARSDCTVVRRGAGLRRAVRRGRRGHRRHDGQRRRRDDDRVSALAAGRNVVPGVDDALFDEAVQTGRLRFSTDPAVVAEAARRADLRADPGRRPPTRPVLRRGRRPRRRRRTCGRAPSSCWSPRPTPARPSRSCARCSRPHGLARRHRLRARLLARADRPGQPEVRPAQHAARSSAASTTDSTELAARLLPPRSSTRSRSSSCCRAAEMAKLLENTFRMVNIALVNELATLCADAGHRRLGGHPGRGHQAVRVHAVLPRPRRRRPLHPARPDLPRLAVPPGHRSAVPAGRDSPRTSTPRCRPTSRRGSSTPSTTGGVTITRRPRARPRRDLQAQRRRRARVGRRSRCSRTCDGAGPRSASTTRSSPRSSEHGLDLTSAVLDRRAYSGSVDCVALLTPHDAVRPATTCVKRAPLVFDARNALASVAPTTGGDAVTRRTRSRRRLPALRPASWSRATGGSLLAARPRRRQQPARAGRLRSGALARCWRPPRSADECAASLAADYGIEPGRPSGPRSSRSSTSSPCEVRSRCSRTAA